MTRISIPGDKVVAPEEDSDEDGKIDKLETYDGDRLASVAFDTQHRGTATGAWSTPLTAVRLELDHRRGPSAGEPFGRRTRTMTSIIYLGCPPGGRDDAERLLWDAMSRCLGGQRRLRSTNWGGATSRARGLSRGAAALQLAGNPRHRASTLMFAVVDERRPDLTTEAVLAGVADVFARPLGGRRVPGPSSAVELRIV
jgi:hypothetical protein